MINYKKSSKSSLIGGGVMAQLSIKDTISLKDMAIRMEKEIGIPMIRSMSVLSAMTEMVRNTLVDGNAVNMEGLGILKVSLGAIENGNPIVKKIIFTPCVQLKKELKEAICQEIKE